MLVKYIKKFEQIFKKHILKIRVDKGLFYSKGRNNIGDSMVPWLVGNVSGGKIEYSNPLEASGSHLFSIGSILQFANRDSLIWGSGFISESSTCKKKPIHVLAVRGPLTARRLMDLYNINVRTYGDPAILTPLYLKKSRQHPIPGRIGIIPHYVDKNSAIEIFEDYDSTFCLIDIETDDIENFAQEIMKCEAILSSSLHGIIISESLGIPSKWISFSDLVQGGGFKFKDYYLSTNRDVDFPTRVETVDDLVQAVKDIPSALNSELLKKMQEELLRKFPKEFRLL